MTRLSALRWVRLIAIGLAAIALVAFVSEVTTGEERVDRSLGRTTWRVPVKWARQILDHSGRPTADTVVLEIPWASLHPRVRALLIGGANSPSGLTIQFWNGDRAFARLAAARASGTYTKVDNPGIGVDVWFDATERRVFGILGHAIGRLPNRPEIEFECDVPMPNSMTPTCALLFPFRAASGDSISAYIHAPYAFLRTTDEVVDRILPVLRGVERR